MPSSSYLSFIDRCGHVATGLLLASVLAFAPAVFAQAQLHSFDIQEQPAATGLNEFARQADVTLVFSYESVSHARTRAVRGEYSLDTALTQLLTGTGLSFERVAEKTIAIGTGTQTHAGEAAIAEVVVTGTRVRGAAPTAAVVTVSREEIARGGYINVQGVLQNTVQNFSGATAATASITGGNLGYSSQVDLRGLGPEATLTLINGRRVAGAAGDDGRAIDIGMIPLAAVERIEILTDGASALYGSDAIGGVVNVILRKDYQGAETAVQYGFNQRAADSYTISQSGGWVWETGRVFGAFQHTQQDPLTYHRLGIHSNDLRSLGGGDFRAPFTTQPGNVLPLGVFDGMPFDGIAGPNGEPVFFAALPPGQNGRNLDPAALRLNELNQASSLAKDVAPDQRNDSVYVTAEQDVGPLTLFADAAYAQRRAINRRSAYTNFLYVPASNAFSPFEEDVLVGYSFDRELGPITVHAESKGWFANAGARGSLPFDGWSWELVGIGSRDESSVDILGYAVPTELGVRLASSDPDHAFNPFGDGTGQSPGVIDALRTGLTFSGTTQQRGITAQAEGALWQLAGGATRLALGGEYRRERVDSATGTKWDGDTLPITPHAARDITALFAEFHVPLIGKDNARPGIQELSLSVAARFEDYSDFGRTTNPRIGLSWRPVDTLQLRAGWGTSFRAPSLRELFFTTALYENIPVFDPRAPGGPATVFTDLLQSGNQHLKQETADVYSAGLTWTPHWLKRGSIALNWFAIDYTDRIRGLLDGLDMATLLELEPTLPPGLVTRDAAGNLTSINLTNLNSASTHMAGLDLSFGYDWAPTRLGSFAVSVAGTTYLKYDDQLIAGVPTLDLAGRVGNPAKWRTRAELIWQRGRWVGNLAVNHVDGLQNFGADPRIVARKVSSQTVLSGQVGVSFDTGLALKLGVDNLFGAQAPFVDGEDRAGVDAQNFVIDGRTVYVKASVAFGER